MRFVTTSRLNPPRGLQARPHGLTWTLTKSKSLGKMQAWTLVRLKPGVINRIPKERKRVILGNLASVAHPVLTRTDTLSIDFHR